MALNILQPAERLIDTDDVMQMLGISKSTLNNMIKDGRFPPPLLTGMHKRRWKSSTIQQWMDGLEQQHQGKEMRP